MIDDGVAPRRQPRWSLIELKERVEELPAPLGIWASASVADRVKLEFSDLPLTVGKDAALGPDARSLVVIGGGTLIDRAKLLRYERHQDLYLVACASIWGSGSEVSPIAVENSGERKRIVMAEGVAPDVRVVWPELAKSVTPAAARAACGDIWAHAVEGLLSPLASESVVLLGGELIRRLLEVPTGAADPRYFDLGAEACLLQAQSSVGLVHGIAHVLEGPLATQYPELGPKGGHAALCATFLFPVLLLLQSLSKTFARRLQQAGVQIGRVLEIAHALHDPELYALALPFLQSNFRAVLRDPCTRTSCALIRPTHIEFFEAGGFA